MWHVIGHCILTHPLEMGMHHLLPTHSKWVYTTSYLTIRNECAPFLTHALEMGEHHFILNHCKWVYTWPLEIGEHYSYPHTWNVCVLSLLEIWWFHLCHVSFRKKLILFCLVSFRNMISFCLVSFRKCDNFVLPLLDM